MSKISINYVHKKTLIRIYKKFKDYPKRSFLPNDFSLDHNKLRETYLDILLKLNLIKEVNVIYFCGNKKRVKHERIGYKLKKYRGEKI